MSHKERVVAVFGGYKTGPQDPLYQLTEELGREIAGAGWTLLNGGYGGCMEASARGANEAGGNVIGIGVSMYRSRFNRFVSEPVMTDDLWQRIAMMLERSDAFIAAPGATGTLAEIAMAWEFIAKKMMPPKPLIMLTDFWTPLYALVTAQTGGEAARGGLVRIEPTPKSAIDFLRKHWQTGFGEGND